MIYDLRWMIGTEIPEVGDVGDNKTRPEAGSSFSSLPPVKSVRIERPARSASPTR